MVEWWKPVVLTFILSLIGGIVYYGFTERAIINYWVEAPDFLNLQLDSYLEVKIKFGNKGNMDASIILKISVENAIILNDTIKPPHKLISRSTAEFYYAVFKNCEGKQVIHIMPKNNAETFTLTVTVQKKLGIHPSEILSWIFGEVKGCYPTSIKYERVNVSTYQKCESSI